jgi:hypothetical protein
MGTCRNLAGDQRRFLGVESVIGLGEIVDHGATMDLLDVADKYRGKVAFGDDAPPNAAFFPVAALDLKFGHGAWVVELFGWLHGPRDGHQLPVLNKIDDKVRRHHHGDFCLGVGGVLDTHRLGNPKRVLSIQRKLLADVANRIRPIEQKEQAKLDVGEQVMDAAGFQPVGTVRVPA